MGVNISKQQFDTFTNIVNKNVTKVTENIYNEQKGVISLDQTIVFRTKGSDVTCNDGLNLSNATNVTLSVLNHAFSQNDSTMQNTIANEVVATIKSLLAQENTQLNLGQANVNVINNTIKTDITRDIKTSFQNSVTQTLEVDSKTTQKITFLITRSVVDVTKKCNISNEAAVDVVIQSALKNLFEIHKMSIDNVKVTADMDSEVAQKNKGIDPIMVLGIVSGVVVLIVVVVGIPLLFKFLKKK